MQLKIYQVDAFAEKLFEGNPAAVCPLDTWLCDALLQNIAAENNLSETAFFVPEESGYALRWFTPAGEVDLCGHATLAAAHVLFMHLGYTRQTITFSTRSGSLEVTRSEPGYSMSFPSSFPKPVEAPALLVKALGVAPIQVLAAFDYVVVLNSASQVQTLSPDFTLLKQLDRRGVVVTATADEVDFVSRCFFPKYRVDEDPVTGSAHCELAPYWAKQLNRTQLVGQQLSARSGIVRCEVVGDRVKLMGRAIDYMSGTITLHSDLA